MSGANETENEILLGNKQLILLFLAFSVLLGVAFTGGYMVGRGGSLHKSSGESATVDRNGDGKQLGGAAPKTAGGETHTVGSTVEPALESSTRPDEPAGLGGAKTSTKDEPTFSGQPSRPADGGEREAPLGSRHAATAPPTKSPEPATGDAYHPTPGTRYLQVAAVNRDEAEMVAGVLHRKGFHAHAVPKPGSAAIYRVIIGPVKDAGDLSSTRDSLHKSGFREVIVQNY